jgi:hypothetical protein
VGRSALNDVVVWEKCWVEPGGSTELKVLGRGMREDL